MEQRPLPTALYCRLSREDGDRMESDSIGNQRKLLEEYIENHPDLTATECYADDGYTGTNFQRPAFQRMLRDVESGRIRCVLVKDLSRFGRDYIETGRYLERWLPEHGVRFIAVTDNIDSARGAYDMMMPLKNLFNTQYARDISQKVKSSLRAKQQRGEFIGAFASYGYCKDPQNHNRLVIDPPAAEVVRRIFTLFENGTGKLRIARQLNEEGIPCPSEYKRLTGEKYRNNHRLAATTYWTYATIHRILQNEMYIGNMEQGRDDRLQMHGKARRKERSLWTVVPGTHQPIIEQDQWRRVQTLLNAKGAGLIEAYRGTALEGAAELAEKAMGPERGPLTAFEKACDDTLTAYLDGAKSVPFGVEVVVGYLYAKESELTAVRTVLSGRLAGLDGELIRSRLRNTYL